MRRHSFSLLILLLAVLALLAGCSTSTPPAATSEKAAPAPQAKPPALYTGLQAFGCVQGLAQKWAVDAMPVRFESEINSEANGQGGKATVWKAAFISHS